MIKLINGDCLTALKNLSDGSVNCCVTSPPYYGLRDYDHPKQAGLEDTPEEYITNMVKVFGEVKRVLRDDGTLWLNIGDSYAANRSYQVSDGKHKAHDFGKSNATKVPEGLKQKDLIGIPWALAKALRDPVYTGVIKKEIDRVWLAAMMDGEGTFSGFIHEREDDKSIRTGVNVCLTNSCGLILDRAQAIWPASSHPHMQNNERLGTKDVFRWKPNGAENVGNFCAELYPYLMTKKRQAMLAWNLMQFAKDGRKLGKSKQAEEVRNKREIIVRLMSQLNKTNCADIPDWIKEPPSMLEDGWYLRQEIIWHKPNPMPESVKDRCTKSHESIFLLSKQPKYYFDREAMKEPAISGPSGSIQKDQPRKFNSTPVYQSNRGGKTQEPVKQGAMGIPEDGMRNKRSVWTVTTKPYKGAHFATFPPDLIEPCILAGCPEGGTVIDPFGGSGTVAGVAVKHNRKSIICELNTDYNKLMVSRIKNISGFETTISKMKKVVL